MSQHTTIRHRTVEDFQPLPNFIQLLEENVDRLPNKPVELIRPILQAQVTSFEKFYEVLRANVGNSELQRALVFAALLLSQHIDKRRVIPALWSIFLSTGDRYILHILGSVGTGRYAGNVLKIAQDRNETLQYRCDALRALWGSPYPYLIPSIQAIMHDQTEDPAIRATAIETAHYVGGQGFLNDYIRLLQDPLADARFWGAYGLSQIWHDITPALEALDQVAAFDHVLPVTWGWHVDREALLPLEHIYLDKLDPDREFSSTPMFLLSPLPEYHDLATHYRKFTDNDRYVTETIPATTLVIEPAWLESKLRERWSDVEINVRQPRPKTYLLDWKFKIDSRMLIGGLHRDQYGIIVTAPYETTIHFANWIRDIIPPKHPLYLYNWADEARALPLIG